MSEKGELLPQLKMNESRRGAFARQATVSARH
jgi:hypothetical protein